MKNMITSPRWQPHSGKNKTLFITCNFSGALVQHYDDSEKQFLIWLHGVGVKFLSLTENQRIRTLDSLISLCGSKEMIHLSDLLPNLLYRDFISLLPTEISTHILMYLDEKSLLSCCLVSK